MSPELQIGCPAYCSRPTAWWCPLQSNAITSSSLSTFSLGCVTESVFFDRADVNFDCGCERQSEYIKLPRGRMQACICMPLCLANLLEQKLNTV